MGVESLFRTFDISASGLKAESVRLEVVANNIANAETTQTPEGGPYRRQVVSFCTVLDGLTGVQVGSVTSAGGAPRMVYNPGHPDADGNGMVAMPDVQTSMEMVDLLTASRAYEANLMAMRNARQICDETIKLLR